MKPLPKNRIELQAEATSLGLLKPNPILDTPRKNLIANVWQSKSIQRSICQGSILLVGSSGVGKSSTINHLFSLQNGITFAKTSDNKSETRITTEYIIKSDYADYNVKDLALGIVDSPGFNDTDGMKQDACNFFSIKQFYEKNPNLSGCYPNLIFLLVQATDTRISGNNSNLGKSLKCLNKLNLVDKKHPNVVGILTWSCSVPGKRNKWKQKIDDKKKILQNIIFQFLHVRAPIVALENEVEENDLDIVDDYSRLPDGSLQPKNVYDACKDLLLKNRDPLGQIILNACFLKAKNPIVGFKVAAKDANKSKLSREEESFFKDFEKAAQGGIEDPIVHSAEMFIQREHLSEEATDEIQECVGKIKELGIENKEELKYIRSGNIISGNHISNSEKKFLEEELEVKSSPVAIGSSRVIGQGYNIRSDKIVPSQILEIETVDSGYGVVIPSMAKFEKVIESRSYMDAFEDNIAMAKSRMSQLNIGLDVDYKQFEFKARAGATMSGSSKTDISSNEVSYLQEERMFELKMANFHDERIKYTKDFVADVDNLPETYNINDPKNRQLYESFFDRWGQFIVVGAYGGGSIESKISSQMISGDHMSFNQLKIGIAAAFNGGVTNVGMTSDFSQEQGIEIKSKSILNASTFAWVGGDRNLHLKSTIEDPESMRKWKLSLMNNPTMLETEMYLEPISTVVGCVNKHKQNTTYSAIKECLGGDFKLVKNKEAEAKAEQLRKEEEIKKREKENEATTRNDTIENPPSGGTSCFPSSAKVTVLQGNEVIERTMNMISEGDLVMIRDMKTKRIMFSPVIMFAHFNKLSKAEYLSITLENGKQITLSRNHLILVGKEGKIIMAEEVKVGDNLFNDNEEKIKVIEIKQVYENGIFSPITYGGTIFVNNILTSCYSSVKDYALFNGVYQMTGHEIAHLGLLPMRIWYNTFSKKKINEKVKAIDRHISEIHPYIRWLIKIELPWMAK